MDIITAINNRISPHKKFYNYHPGYINNLREYGEDGVVTRDLKLVGKLQDKGLK